MTVAHDALRWYAVRRLLITGKPRVVAIDDCLVIDTLRREADVTRSAITRRRIDLKGPFLDCVAKRPQEARDLRNPKQVALEDRIQELEDFDPESAAPNVCSIDGKRRK